MSNDMKVGDTYFDFKKHYQINLGLIVIFEMYDRDVMFEHMRRKELNDAIKNTTEVVTKEVTNNITNKIVINMIKENTNIDFISKTTGLSIEEINEIKKGLN